ncbi:PGF-CTERM sorting domain-containing protein [Methanococcoides sp. SA1]|nr:PGF-CTERM sorting domain-containing protein [Methanococcoides sp. SA1]
MKSFIAILMAALLVLSFVSVASAVDTIEIRSPVMAGNLDGERNLSNVTLNSTTFTDFAAFFYDIDDGIGSEKIDIITAATTDTIPEAELIYTSDLQTVSFTYAGWADSPVASTFDKIGFLAEEYVPIDQDPSILSKLILDDDEKYTMRVGQTLDLGDGFAITPKQIDVDGNKVWLELSKDGKFLDDDVFNTEDNMDNSSWDYDTTVGGEDDIVIMRVHVNEVFQGQVDSLVIIEGMWLISDEAMELEDDDEFGKFEVTSLTAGAVGTGKIVMKTTEDITLSKDSSIEITEDIMIKTADSDDLRFYFAKEISEPGTYEIRGTVATPDASATVVSTESWTAASFAGFYYDIDEDISSETLTAIVEGSANRTIAEDNLTYTSVLQTVSYTYAGWADSPVASTFDKIGFFAEEYVPIDQDPSILSKLILDDDEKYTMRVGQTLDLGDGFAITPKQIDVDGNKVWLELSKDGKFLDDDVFNTEDNMDNSSWDYDTTVGGEDDIVIMRVHVNEVFQGQVDSLAIIEGMWLISDEAMEIEDDDEFGKLEVTGITTGATGTISMDSTESITLTADSTKDIAEGISFKVADSADTEVRFYPFIEATIAGAEETPEEETPEEETPEEETPEEEVPGEEVPGEEVPGEEVPEETPEDVDDGEDTEEPGVPGFEAVFAIAGLLAVAYFVRRN